MTWEPVTSSRSASSWWSYRVRLRSVAQWVKDSTTASSSVSAAGSAGAAGGVRVIASSAAYLRPLSAGVDRRVQACRSVAVGGEDFVIEPGPQGDVDLLVERALTEEHRGQVRLAIHPEEAARLSEVAEGACGGVLGGPMRGLVAADLHAQPPVIILLPAIPREHAVQSLELHRGGLLAQLGGDQGRHQQFQGEGE